MTDAERFREMEGKKSMEKRTLSEIKKELVQEMRKRLSAEQNIHFLLVEMFATAQTERQGDTDD